ADPLGDGAQVAVREAAGVAGRHIRRAGQDFALGDVLVPEGKRLGARDIGLLAAGNHPWVSVHRRPRVALLATGDEIALPGEAIPRGGIVSSNTHALAALVRACGGDPVILPIAPDNVDAIAEAGERAAGCDVLVTSGGASVGEHDLVAAGLGPRLQLDFWKIAMRPGKPLMAGTLGDLPTLGLPGNPVSALVCGILFLAPAVERLCGLAGDPPPTAEALLGGPVPANDARADHLRATLEQGEGGTLVATAFERQDSAMLRLLARADGLILRPPHAPALPSGSRVPVIRLDALGL
ncbi:MAG: molybdopterin molybdotransferase MoeA, partial [Acidisphaera sp.]|nr:molybdopterin molybdotransferase MoeA [Acidisphaera sp.]